ncbi:MAG: hypothetical protein JW932_18390 [Deltaproteobacteria bacterium]|nr:hypothetical protein [Deltaproteobacteria bacterium]
MTKQILIRILFFIIRFEDFSRSYYANRIRIGDYKGAPYWQPNGYAPVN